jgi:hypothetical protein
LVFVPDNTNAPVPNFSKSVDPDTTPGIANTFEPVTSTLPPLVDKTTERPTPKSAAAPVFCNVPPCNVSELPVPKPDPAEIDKTPPVTVMFPLSVLTPDKVSVPVPALVTAEEPLSTPLNTTSDAAVMVVGAATEDAPEKLNIPVFVASPSVTVAGKANPFANDLAVIPSLESVVPDDNVTDPVPNAVSLPTRNTPALNVVPPLNVLAPESVNAPAPVFVNAFPETTPETVNPAPVATSNTAFPAPIASTRFTPRLTVPAVNPNVDPPETANVFVADASPKLPLDAKLKTPPLTVKGPLNVFEPESVNVPVPDFSNAPAPEATPEIVRAFAPVTSTRPPPVPNTTPRPDPKSTDAPVLCNTPPCNVRLDPVPRPDAAPIDTVPAFTVTAPLNVFAPLKVNVPLPAFVRLVNPLTTLLIVTFDAVVKVGAELNATAPEIVNAPVFTASPKVTAPDTANAFANVRAVTLSLVNVVPDAKVTVPDPSAPLFPTRTVPAFTTVPPP